MFESNFDLLAVGAESTPGTAVTPTVGVRMYDLQFKPEIEMHGEKMASGDAGQSRKYSGMAQVGFTGFTYLTVPSALDAEPDWSVLFKGCGFVHTQHTTVGQSWAFRASGFLQTLTQWFLMREAGASPQQRRTPGKGCMGKLKIVADKPGAPIKIMLDFTGAYTAEGDIVTGSQILLGTVNTTAAAKLLSWVVNVHGHTGFKVNNFEIDFQIEVMMVPDQGDTSATGIAYFRVTGAEPQIKLQVEVPRISSFDFRSKITTDATGTFVMHNGGSGVTRLAFNAPVVQLISWEPIEVEGSHYANLVLHCIRNGTVDAAMEDEDMLEMLHGSKT